MPPIMLPSIPVFYHRPDLVCYTARVKVFKTAGGVLLILIGFVALVTPLTPGAWLMLVGLELIGVRLTLWDSIKIWIQKRRGIHANDTKESDTASTPK